MPRRLNLYNLLLFLTISMFIIVVIQYYADQTLTTDPILVRYNCLVIYVLNLTGIKNLDTFFI